MVGSVSSFASYPLNPSQMKKPAVVKQLLNVMRKTVHKEGLIDGGMSEDIFEDMLYDEYAKKMAETAQFGLAETIYRQVSSKA
jgi:flagellar protein FlgJ